MSIMDEFLHKKCGMQYYYPAKFEPAEEGGFVVTFRDVPEAITQGDTLDEAREMAEKALLTALEFYVERKEPYPTRSRCRTGEHLVYVNPPELPYEYEPIYIVYSDYSVETITRMSYLANTYRYTFHHVAFDPRICNEVASEESAVEHCRRNCSFG
jgi:predicted RNase H-like HicB family nuclease